MKKITLLTFVLFSILSYAQVGINTNTPDASSALEIESTTGGILIPRLTETQRDEITAPATGLMIYQTNQTSGFYFYDGSVWTKIDGVAGPQGEAGPQGIQGTQGDVGLTGAPGPPGSNGANGPQGEAGPQGIQGVQGDVGLTGAPGPPGANGANGSQGEAGLQGNQGVQGDVGPLVSGTNGQTLYNNGTEWVATSNLLNTGASVGIGLTSTIDASAVLQIESTTQGVLFPKMTLEERGLISSPQIGLFVFQTDTNPGFYFYDGSSWVALNTANGSSSGGSNPKTLIYTSQGF